MNETLYVEYVEEGKWVQMSAPASGQQKILAYNSSEFWTFANDRKTPLELLVKLLRSNVLGNDKRGSDKIFEIINGRIRRDNEHWAYWKLNRLNAAYEERQFLIRDLCADLDFAIYRALIDKTKYYWEKNFSTSLHFERKHVFSRFIQYECFWKSGYVKQGIRIPRAQVISIDKVMQDLYRLDFPFDIEDSRVQRMMDSVELSYVRQCVLKIPYRLRVVVYLIYWNGRSSKEIAQLLHISDRTVRNRLHAAYALLRDALEADIFYT